MDPEWIVAGLFGLAVLAIPAAIILGPKIFRPSQRVPGFNTRMQGCPYPVTDVGSLIHDFLSEWEKEFGKTEASMVKTAIDALNIVWHSGDSFVDELGRTVRGLTRTNNVIEVAAREPLGVRSTGLAHELVHVALLELDGDPDSDHAAGAGGWKPVHDDIVERRLKCEPGRCRPASVPLTRFSTPGSSIPGATTSPSIRIAKLTARTTSKTPPK